MDKSSSQVLENGGTTAPKRGCAARTGAHCKKFWWAYLIAFVIVVLVVILPVVYVGYPNLAQSDVDKSTLSITEMEITEPRPDGFKVKVNQVIGSKSSHHPVLDAFDADVSLVDKKDDVFLVLRTPEIKSHDGVEALIEQDITLDDLAAFTEYSKAVMHEEDLELYVSGQTGLKLGGLPKTTVDYNKIVPMKGLNSLKGFDVTDFSIQSSKDDGPNMVGEVFIPNPSVLTLTMGNLTLNLSVDGKDIGTSHLNDVVIKPGDNTIKMESTVDQPYIVSLISSKGKYSKGIVPIDIVGNSSVYNGEKLPYFSEALASNKLRVELDILAGLGGSSS